MNETPYIGHELGTSVQVYTGSLIDPFNLDITDLDIRDVVHKLSQMPRWNCFGREDYKVGQHSVLVMRCVEDHIGLSEETAPILRQALLHEMDEVYFWDIPSPFKRNPAMKPIIEAGRKISSLAAQKWNFPTEMHPLVKEADEHMLIVEGTQFFRPPVFGDKRMNYPKIDVWTMDKTKWVMYEEFLRLTDG